VGEDRSILVQLDAEQPAWKLFHYRPGDLNTIFFTHPPPEIGVRIAQSRKTGIRYRKVYRALMHIVENFGRLFYP